MSTKRNYLLKELTATCEFLGIETPEFNISETGKVVSFVNNRGTTTKFYHLLSYPSRCELRVSLCQKLFNELIKLPLNSPNKEIL